MKTNASASKSLSLGVGLLAVSGLLLIPLAIGMQSLRGGATVLGIANDRNTVPFGWYASRDKDMSKYNLQCIAAENCDISILQNETNSNLLVISEPVAVRADWQSASPYRKQEFVWNEEVVEFTFEEIQLDNNASRSFQVYGCNEAQECLSIVMLGEALNSKSLQSLISSL